MNIDFGPTFLDYAGVPVPEDMQGRSLRPVLDGDGEIPEDWREAAYYHYYEYPAEHSVKRHYGIRTSDCKLIHFYNDIDEWEMYDMVNDPQEMNNVYDDPAYAAKRAQMHELLEQVQQEYQDTDPCEKVKVLFQGDRRNFDRRK
jgi:arylsulfatase A-like enzyme